MLEEKRVYDRIASTIATLVGITAFGTKADLLPIATEPAPHLTVGRT